MRVLLAAFVAASLAQVPATLPQDAWPPAGVIAAKDLDSPPQVQSRVQAAYPEAAIRRRIQGFVTLQFVVEPDGAIGPVRVRRSLDAASGVDAAAVEALKRWRFAPGMKDGRPVRTAASLVMTMTLDGVPVPMTLPEGFETVADDASRWSQSEVTVGGVHIRFAWPDGWQVPDAPALAVLMTHPGALRSVAIYRPAPLPRPIPFPMPLQDLARFSESMRGRFGSAPQPAEVVAVGQSPFGTANWLWLELAIADTAHAWAFNTSVGSQMIQVMCSVDTPTLRMTEAERDAAIAGARADCAGILGRLTLSAP